jgi:hypothetical protein
MPSFNHTFESKPIHPMMGPRADACAGACAITGLPIAETIIAYAERVIWCIGTFCANLD